GGAGAVHLGARRGSHLHRLRSHHRREGHRACPNRLPLAMRAILSTPTSASAVAQLPSRLTANTHRTQAYMAPRTGSGHGVRVGFIAHGCQPVLAHGSPSTPSAFSATGASCPPKILFDRAGDLPGSAPPPA